MSNKTEHQESTGTHTPDEAKPTATTKPKYIDSSRIFWGSVLIAVGVLALLDSFDIIRVNFADLWRLWPLLLIIWGISVLKLRGIWWTIVSTLLILGSIALLVSIAVGEKSSDQQPGLSVKNTKLEAAKPAETIKNLDVRIDSGAGKIIINSDKEIASATTVLQSNFATLEKNESTSGDTRTISLKTEGTVRWWRGDFKNELTTQISESMPVALTIDTGAADVNADLSRVQLTDLNIKTGASNIDITLGTQTAMIQAKLDAGASSVTFRIPKSSGVRVTVDSGLSDKSFEGLQEVSPGVYESDDYRSATNKIDLSADIGATSFRIVRY